MSEQTPEPTAEQTAEQAGERRKLSLGSVKPDDGPSGADPTRGWKISPARREKVREHARDMRRNPTEAEALLWARLKDKAQGGFTFGHQVIMGSTVVDFACKSRWLVVEVSGPGEADATLAALSDRKLIEVGVRVLRFTEDQVRDDIETVIRAINVELQKPFERPVIQAPRPRSARRSERSYAQD